MKKKKFTLEGILKIREYREFEARKSLIMAKKPIELLQQKIFTLEKKYAQAINTWQNVISSLVDNKVHIKSESDNISQVIYCQSVVSECKKAIDTLKEKKIVMEKEIQQQIEKYNTSKQELESINILHNKFEQAEKKKRITKQLDELQEKIV